jgi:3-oxoacyl-[acyl-carrier protein] reductase
MITKHPLKRILQPEKVAKTVDFQLEEDAKEIIAQTVIQDNGLISISN